MNKIYDEFFDETYYKEKLENGLEVIIFHKPDFLTTACAFGTSYGALNIKQLFKGKEYSFNPGIAHFLEHKLFESEEKDIFATFSNMGCNVNAFTSYGETVYYFTTTNTNIEEPLNLLLDFVLSLDITDKTVEKEKGIIIQELSMYMQNPDSRLLQEAYRSMYEKYPLKYDIGGDDKTVTAITKDELELCYKLNYHPSNMAIVIVSPLDPNELIEIVRKNQKSKSFVLEDIPKTIIEEEKEEVFRKEYSFKMDINKPKHVYAIKLKPDFNNKQDMVKKEWCLNIYLKAYFSPINPQYQKWLDDNIINNYFGYEVDFSDNYAYVLFYSESSQDNLKKLVDETLKEDLFNEEKLTQIKRHYIGSSFEDFDDIENFDLGFIRDYLNGTDFFENIKTLINISSNDVLSVYKGFKYDNYALIHIYPQL